MKIRLLRESQIIFGLIFPILLSQFTYAYETATHDKLSKDAIKASALEQDTSLLLQIGINGGTEQGLFPSTLPLDADTPDKTKFEPAASISAIITGGAVLEDAFPRSLGHFFDPRYDRSLSNSTHRSPDWILETDAQGNRLDLSAQNFSYADAIDYFYAALRGQDELGNLLSEAQRNEQFGFMFRSLGHIIHHIQDMAQPQHVRHDAHCNLIACGPLYNPSLYESYTNEVRSNLEVSGYLNVTLNSARDYWTTSLNSPQNGNGLADFTNANFFSSGSNLILTDNDVSLNSPYTFPRPLQDSSGDVIFEPIHLSQLPQFISPATLQALNCDSNPDCVVEFVKTDVQDNFDPAQSSINNRASSLSVFDKHLLARGGAVIYGPSGMGVPFLTGRVFTLNKANFAEAHKFLIKRAVAYSAGMINHFFRGRLQVVSTVTNSINQIEVTIKNVSATGNDFINRNFEVHYDKDDGTRAQIGAFLVEGGTAPVFAVNDTVKLTFTPPVDVDPTKSKPYTIVYNDQIGQEQGVATVGFNNQEMLCNDANAQPLTFNFLQINVNSTKHYYGVAVGANFVSGGPFTYEEILPLSQGKLIWTDPQTGLVTLEYRLPGTSINQYFISNIGTGWEINFFSDQYPWQSGSTGINAIINFLAEESERLQIGLPTCLIP